MKLPGFLLMITAACAFTSNAVAATGTKTQARADVTIAVMDKGETPRQFVHRIELPGVGNILRAGFDNGVDVKLRGIARQARNAGDAAANDASQSIKDDLSIQCKQSAPDDIVHHLNPDQPLVNKVPVKVPGMPE